MAMAVSNQQSRDAALLRATTELFSLGAQHDADEIRRFEELATHFIGKVSAADRAFVAERLTKTKDAPGSVLRLLGKDLIEIAAPVLRRAEGLSEIDLLSILSTTGPAHHRQIAQRPNLPAPVVTALRLAGDPETVRLLAAYPQPEAAPVAPAAPAPEVVSARPQAVPAEAKRAPAKDGPEAREVFAVARAMTAALSFEMTSLASGSPETQLPAPETASALLAREEEASTPAPAAQKPATLDAKVVEPVATQPAVLEPAPSKAANPVLLELPEIEAEPEPSEAERLPTHADIRQIDVALDAGPVEPPVAEELEAEAASPYAVPAIVDFLSLDARERFEALARLLGRAGPADPGMTVIDADNAFRVALGNARVSQHARRRQREALIAALAHGLRLDVESVTEIADDPSGEALVVLLRAIGLSEAEAHQILLFANPAIAEAVETFFRLARLSGEIGRDAADRIVSAWRGDAPASAGHQPYLADTMMRRDPRGNAVRPVEHEAAAERRSAG